MTVDFSKILSKQSATIEKPKPIPVGHYIAVNQKMPEFTGVGKNETPAANFTLLLLAPTEDVDPAQLTEFGDIKGKTVRYTQWLSENAEFRSKEELINVFQIEEGDKTFGQLYNETINKQVIVEIIHVPSDNGEEIYSRANSLAAA